MNKNNTYCNCGKMAGSAEWGVMGVIGPGVAGPILAGAADVTEPPTLTIGDEIIVCCCKLKKLWLNDKVTLLVTHNTTLFGWYENTTTIANNVITKSNR